MLGFFCTLPRCLRDNAICMNHKKEVVVQGNMSQEKSRKFGRGSFGPKFNWPPQGYHMEDTSKLASLKIIL